MAVIPSALLGRFRGLVVPELRAAVAALEPRLALMSGYAFGWCDADGAPADGSGGKMLRSALALLSAELVGTPAEEALPGAVAVELLHVFSLIHDDIMDRDEQRRHRPTVWKAYGTGPAILAGDALFALATRTVAHAPRGGQAASHLLADTGLRLCQGQAQDLAFEQRPWTGPDMVTSAEYKAMAADKTGSLISCALAIGALLASAPPLAAETLAKAGHEFGLAFQIIDDVLAGTGDPALTGKPVLNDLRTRKKSYPVLAALASPNQAGTRLRTVMAADDRLRDEQLAATSDEDLARIGDLVAEAGGYQQATREARRRVDNGLTALTRAHFDQAAVEDLSTLTAFLLNRSA
ncbi:polyprenyl synthetase family protein [Streptomyces sp. NPDC086783]|uniref:polyprenyl synthetase family protein n=1 Tax=Streptomyces sp. NPDC086783 TaxID=3365758 RepID=UPI003805C1BD